MDPHQAGGLRAGVPSKKRQTRAVGFLHKRRLVSTKPPFRAFYPPSAGSTPTPSATRREPNKLDQWCVRLSESLRVGREKVREAAHSAQSPMSHLLYMAAHGPRPWPIDALTYLAKRPRSAFGDKSSSAA